MERFRHQKFGTHPDGSEVTKYTLINLSGIQVSVLDWGCTLTKILTPDALGQPADILLGFDDLAGYLDPENPYMGAIIGRTANRVAGHTIHLEGHNWPLTANHGAHHLHGGTRGFDKQHWNVHDPIETTDAVSLTFTYSSPHLDQGYPGNLEVSTILTLDDKDCLTIRYEAATDQPTVVNLTHHPYFNLSGNPQATCEHHILTLNGSHFTDADPDLLPTGKLCPVQGLALDFRSPQRVGSRIRHTEYPMAFTRGYDHNYILDKSGDPLIDTPEKAAILFEPESGRQVTIYTTQPCLQFYTGNHLGPEMIGKNNVPYFPHAGLCLEPQGFPDATRYDHFETTLLTPEETYCQTIQYAFGFNAEEGERQ